MWGIPLSPKPRLAGDAAPCRSSQPRTTRKEKGFGHLLPALPTGKNSPFFFCCTTPEFSAFKRVLFLSFNLSLKPITNCNLENSKLLKHFKYIFPGISFLTLALYNHNIKMRSLLHVSKTWASQEKWEKSVHAGLHHAVWCPACCSSLVNLSAASCAVINTACLAQSRQALVLGNHCVVCPSPSPQLGEGLNKLLLDFYSFAKFPY